MIDFSPLSGSLPPSLSGSLPPSLSAPFGRGELSPAAAPPSPFHFSHSFCARHLLSKQGRQFANSPHSYMIDNRKPLSGADDYFFQVLVPPPRHEKMPPRAAARFARAKNRHCIHLLCPVLGVTSYKVSIAYLSQHRQSRCQSQTLIYSNVSLPNYCSLICGGRRESTRLINEPVLEK